MQPRTEDVYKTPIFIVPPQINKFYVWDLAPNRSVIEYLTKAGHQVFIVSWRNPGARAEADWGLNTYVEALDRASDVAVRHHQIRGAEHHRRLLWRDHGGDADRAVDGAKGDDGAGQQRLPAWSRSWRSRAARTPRWGCSPISKPWKMARMFSGRKGVLEGKDLERTFAWLRPNDLIWAYWVNNYLIGNDPPGVRHPVLERRHDQPDGGPARRSDRTAAARAWTFGRPKGWEVAGPPTERSSDVQVRRLHRWRRDRPHHPLGRMLSVEERLRRRQHFPAQSQAGHIQSLINPPGNPRRRKVHDQCR